ncbi:putative 5'(3')-deoxyribonucleotidase [Parapedobacter pyrenivorans]|uniref:5'(3')-deoxyribonucleotidase n=1 Tax=Parapedobacter pyrenivorans TaxID=1305674 RepID=A0A917I045_9SPHI|nr:5'(3')-deoxyribonucleotidase [Parapedobacter pyrenivorans]GGH00900.1 putative 5'(3')-deoxyribonucleotidase [Parapedobacter pyrenivorans]
MINNEKPRLAIDMDEVLTDTLRKFLTLYNRDYGIAMDIHQAPGKELHENLPEGVNGQWKIYANEKGFFRDIPPMPDAIETVKALSAHYNVYIVSAAMEFRNSLEDKFDWLGEHFPFIPWTNILFTGDKIISADILIDDRVRNLVHFNGRKLLFTSPHNLLVNEYERVNNWKEVAGLLL